MINAFALAVHVAFYNALRRWHRGCRNRLKQYRLGCDRNGQRAVDLRALVAVPPIPRSNKSSSPKSPLLMTRLLFLTNIRRRVSNEGHGPSFVHQPGVQVFCSSPTTDTIPARSRRISGIATFRIRPAIPPWRHSGSRSFFAIDFGSRSVCSCSNKLFPRHTHRLSRKMT
jgi:hypothetical protein